MSSSSRSGITSASRSSSSRSSSVSNTGTVRYGTLLSSGATASYPSSFASSPQYNPSTASTGGDKLSGGTIAGIAVACVAFVLLVAFLVGLFFIRRRRANKRKRDSRTGLLPPPSLSAGSNGQPEMSQYPNYATTGMSSGGDAHTAPASNMPIAPAAAATLPYANHRSKLQSIPGLSFGSGSHRRTDSNNSTTPFLAGAPDSPSRPSTGNGSMEANRSPQSNRYSLESTTTYTGSPNMPHQNRFSSSQFGSSP
ncbi:hypothetical protein P389DRAFT_164752 [Cystobasidium minutum MCA 4210]|uniref:uncharacterized protein n=1 Tax=Cystobasidium minutum MCA 4210 TaxID=1397322 RepID=UPI0034CE9759|eukprot:jgi/Rhomi1/164752/fgenesh1_kg.1_\